MAVPIANIMEPADWQDREMERLEAENAQLRELVRHLYECTRHNVCVLCDYADDACDFEYDMRELGVEP